MSNPIKRLGLIQQSGVLPFRYELILNNNNVPQQQQRGESTSAEPKPSMTIENNPYYEKYAEKIKKAQVEKQKIIKEKDVNASTDDISSKQNQTSRFQESKNETPNQLADKPTKAITESVEDKQTQSSSMNVSNSVKKSRSSLNDIVKLDLLNEKTKEEITEIWNTYHSKKDCIYASIPTVSYEPFYQNVQKYPAFILPLPRNSSNSSSNDANASTSDGYEFFLLQFQEHCCYFTPLAAFHLHKEIAPVCLTIHYYPELSQTKDIVLMMGEYDSNILTIMEAQFLANQLNYYYTTKDEASKLSLHLFNKEPKSFDHMRLVRHLENVILTNGLDSIDLKKPD